MKIKMIIAFIVIAITVSSLWFFAKRRRDNHEVMMGPPWLLYSDEKLLQTFEDEALNGKARTLQANKILYERFYLTRGDVNRARSFLNAAADLGDEEAKKILNDPDKYLIEFRKTVK